MVSWGNVVPSFLYTMLKKHFGLSWMFWEEVPVSCSVKTLTLAKNLSPIFDNEKSLLFLNFAMLAT